MDKKNFYKKALKMAWPSVLESFFLSLAGMIDTLMVSALGPAAIAAVGLTNQPKFIGLAVFFSISIAVSALVARRKGQENKYGANQILVTALTVVLILTVIITTVMCVWADPILRMAGSNADTHKIAHEYFLIIMGFCIFNTISITINAAQRGSGNTKIAFTTNFVSTIVNITFNFLLIKGRFGFPELGITGAAIATVVGAFVAAVMSIRSLFKKNSYVSIPYISKNKINPSTDALKSISLLGSNLLVENFAMRVGFLTTAMLAAGLGTEQFAAHNVGMQFLSLGFAFADGMQVAAVSLSGQALGAKKPDDAIMYGHACQKIGLGISVLLSILFFAFGDTLYGLFFDEPHIIEYGLLILKFITVIVLLQISQIIYGGVLRAAGDVKYTLLSTIVSVTIIRTVVTYVLVKVVGLGLTGIWIGVLSDQFSRFVFNSLRFKSKRWIKIEI